MVRQRLVPLKIEKTGGGDGSNTSAATYTYKVFCADDGEITLGEEFEVLRPREFGSMKPQEGENAYGVAMFIITGDGDEATKELRLWDAGEIPEIDACPSEEHSGHDVMAYKNRLNSDGKIKLKDGKRILTDSDAPSPCCCGKGEYKFGENGAGGDEGFDNE